MDRGTSGVYPLVHPAEPLVFRRIFGHPVSWPQLLVCGPDRRDRRCPPEPFPARRYAPPRMGPSLEPDAEDQDRLKSELVATVSHEMRRPLTAILGFSQTLRTRWEDLPSQLRGELLERVEQNAQAMSHMIGQVLDFS